MICGSATRRTSYLCDSCDVWMDGQYCMSAQFEHAVLKDTLTSNSFDHFEVGRHMSRSPGLYQVGLQPKRKCLGAFEPRSEGEGVATTYF